MSEMGVYFAAFVVGVWVFAGAQSIATGLTDIADAIVDHAMAVERLVKALEKDGDK